MDELSPMAESLVSMHETFLSLVQAGFTENQALRLCAYIITANQIPDSG